MSEILLQYNRVDPTTWVYLSSLLMIGMYFKFSRVWSVRNLDLILLILLSPGPLLVLRGRSLPPVADAQLSQPLQAPDANVAEVPPQVPANGTDSQESVSQESAEPSPHASNLERMGYVWLFAVGFVLLLRLLCDPLMMRRPLLEPNMTVGGLAFIGVSLFAFLMANVLTGQPTEEDLVGPRQADRLVRGDAAEVSAEEALDRWGPGFPLLYILPQISTSSLMGDSSDPPSERRQMGFIATARAMAILSHVALIVGLIVIGYWHLQSIRTGIALATLYLLLPYTSQLTGRVDHILPAALLVWAVASYRSPIIAGMFVGLAAGVIYYPAFLLPLWLSFYWERGARRFISGVLITVAILVAALALTSDTSAMFLVRLRHMFGWRLPTSEPMGFWTMNIVDQVYRLPVLAGFVMMCVGLFFWPAQKNLGTLMSCTGAVMLCTQFWHAHGGGLFVAWYLPLLLLTIFRTNLDDRVATAVVSDRLLKGNYAWIRKLPGANVWRHRAAL
jgi:hypothetical protein